MNMLAIGLVLTSLVTASIWSPSPPPFRQDEHQEVIVKEGHRVVVVEYDKEADGSTKVLISPHEVVDSKETTTTEEEENPKPTDGMFSGPRELVCDAFGKCKHKLATALGKTKDTVQEVEEHTSEAVGKAKETVHGYEERAKEAVKEATEKVTGRSIGESIDEAKDGVAQGIGKAKKVTEDVVGTVKDSALKTKNFDMVDSLKRIGEDIQRNVSGKIEEGVEHVKEQAKETVKNVQQVGQKSLGEILNKLKEVTYDVMWYMMSRDKVNAVVGLIHMLGFSTAYGMCVWVTFVSSYILGRYLPRQQFGMVQSRIYPVYFKAMAYCVSGALLGHLASQKRHLFYSLMEMFQGLSLFSALLMILSNMVLLEPKATKVKFN